MPSRHHGSRTLAAALWALLALSFALCAQAADPKRVLIIHSFGREVSPYNAITAAFRAELARASPETIIFLEATLDAGRVTSPHEEEAFAQYLKARFSNDRPDLVVTVGPMAARFYSARRERLFPKLPFMAAALDQRLARTLPLGAGDVAVTGKIDFVALVNDILALLPETETIFIVRGATPLERYWVNEVLRELGPSFPRLKFVSTSELSIDQIAEALAQAPPHSAVLYGLFLTDAAGIPHERMDALERLHALSNAPIFGLYEVEIGRGVVGGPHSSQIKRGQQMASHALRILAGDRPDQPVFLATGFERPAYDWRELRRWHIDDSRLPPGSEVRFRPPSLWEEHRTEIIVLATVLAAQGMLIAALLWQRLARRRAEREARSLGGRLISAHEDERRRLARDLHDDITQRLAGLAISASKLEDGRRAPGAQPAATSLHDSLVELSEDVHALSYRLHPTVIEDLGLVEALRAECDRVARHEGLRVSFDAASIPGKVPSDLAVGLFRVAQEALRNVVRHANASEVQVSLHDGDHQLTLVVHDNGAGFDASRRGMNASLGLASMRERMRLVDGTLAVETTPGRGTTITAQAPLQEAM